MRSKIILAVVFLGLALALALFALGINQANAAMIYFNCVERGSNFDLQVNTVTGYIVGADTIDHERDPAWINGEPFSRTCKIGLLEFSCKQFDKTGREVSFLSLSRVSGRLSITDTIEPKMFGPMVYGCKLTPKKF